MQNKDEYTKYKTKGDKILARLKRVIEATGYVENLGQKEARMFNDNVMAAFSKSKLTYEQASGLSVWMHQSVLEL